MSDDPETPPNPNATAAQRALALKQASGRSAPGGVNGGRRDAERAAAARSASKSKPWMKKH